MKKLLAIYLCLFFCSELIAQPYFEKVEEEASFPGGDKGWRTYLTENVDFEVASNSYAPPGSYTVIIQFLVDKDGSLTDIKALTNHGFGMEEEVIRVIRSGPKWVPAKQNGRVVKAYRKQPVTFQIISDLSLSTYTINAGKPTTIEIEVDRSGVNYDDLEVTVSNGTIRREEGKKYIITVDKPGQVLLTVRKTAKKKKDEENYGTVAIAVK